MSIRYHKYLGELWEDLNLEDLVSACRHDNAAISEFDTSCFSGTYVTGDITPEYLERLERERNDDARSLRRDSPLKAVN